MRTEASAKPENNQKTTEIDDAIDEKIYQIYGLSQEERAR